MVGSSQALGLVLGGGILAVLCLVTTSTHAADESKEEKLGRESAELFFETLVPLVERGTKIDFMGTLEVEGLRCRDKRQKRVDCVINGRSRFIARFESGTMWAVLLVSTQNGVCRGMLGHTKQVLGEPTSNEDGWLEWRDDGKKRLTGFKEKIACQLVHAQTQRDQ
jgi:hypothetical protein